MKKGMYTFLEVEQIIQKVIEEVHIRALEYLQDEPTPQPARAYNVVGTRTPERRADVNLHHNGRGGLGNCRACGAELEPSKFPGGKPWCLICWSAKKDGK